MQVQLARLNIQVCADQHTAKSLRSELEKFMFFESVFNALQKHGELVVDTESFTKEDLKELQKHLHNKKLLSRLKYNEEGYTIPSSNASTLEMSHDEYGCTQINIIQKF